MSTGNGENIFEGVAEIGVANSYNSQQLSAAFMGAKHVIETTSGDLAGKIAANTADIAAIQSSGTSHDTTYQLETDSFADPQIQLVDSDGNFTNVKLTGVSGIVTSTKSLNELEIAATGLVTDILALQAAIDALDARVTALGG